MKRIWVLILLLVLLQDSKGHTSSFKHLQSCPLSPELEEKCLRHIHQVTRTMFLYFEKVNKEIEEHSEELKSRDNRIKQLEERKIEPERESKNKKNQIQNLEEKDILHLREVDSKNKQIVHLQEMEIEYLRELKIKGEQVGKLQIENTIYKSKEDSMATVLKELRQLATNQCQSENKEIEELKSQISSKGEYLEKVEAELTSHKNIIDERDQKIKELEEKVKELTGKEEDKKSKSCIGRGSAGVQTVTLSKGLTFEVLCNSNIAGPGWTVIQQRIDGKVDFYRNWDTYRDGFGDFWDGDFFLGLEKIHRLTAEEPHELYIHMERFNGSTFHARYDEFAIACENDQYRLIRLGKFSGSTEDDMMSNHEYKKFTTYDRDNDDNGGNCAKMFHGAWWYYGCASTNLNGRYYSTQVWEWDSIFWEDFTSLKQVKMMIRPKGTSK